MSLIIFIELVDKVYFVGIGNCLMQDLRLCQQDDPYLFCFLLPLVLSQDLLPNYVINNSDLIYLIVSCIDSRLLKDLISSIISQDLVLINHKDEKESNGEKSSSSKASRTRGNKKTTPLNTKKRKRKDSDTETSKSTTPNKKGASALSQLKMSKSMKRKQKFKKESLIDVLNASFNWETIEQIFFWEILMAHECVSLSYLLPVFNRLDANKHSEAVCHLFQLIKSTEPSYDLVKLVVQRREEDNLARALLINWCRQSSESNRMINIFVKLIKKSAASSNQSQIAQSPHNKPESTYKKITVGSSNNNNKVKLTAQQQLEQIEKQKRLNAQQQGNNNSSLILIDPEDYNKTPSLDQVLGHLNKIRLNQSCINFILHEHLIDELKTIYNKNLNDELKKKYSDLFTLADQFEERDVNRSMSEISSESENDDDDDNDDQNESGAESNKSGSENENEDSKRKSTTRGNNKSGKTRQQSKKQLRSAKSNKTTRKSTTNKSVKSTAKTAKKNTRSSKAATSDVSNESSNEDEDGSSSSDAGDDKNETEKVTETENTSGSNTSSSSSATSSEDEYSAKSKKTSSSSKVKRTSGANNKAGRPRKKPKHQSNKSDNDSD